MAAKKRKKAARKKTAKKPAVAVKNDTSNGWGSSIWTKIILSLLIIIFLWSSAEMWSKVLITICAVVIFLMTVTSAKDCKV